VYRGVDKLDHRFLLGDSLEMLRNLPDQSVHCCVTSPPYYGLRDYGIGGQIGLEQTPDEYIAKMVQVFGEVKRVLRDDGTVFLNIGDSYCGTGNKGDYKDPKYKEGRNGQAVAVNNKIEGLKPKDLIGIPWLLAFALRADGWYLRSDIIWHKPNCMPEPVRDRPTKAHEYVFLLSKSSKYWYDHEAIKEQSQSDHPSGNGFKRKARLSYQNADGTARGNDEPWQLQPMRNKRSVWSISTKPFRGAHFAVFPEELIEPCILAGCPEKTCPVCGTPWKRVIEKTGHKNKREQAHVPGNCDTKTDSTGWQPTTRATDTFKPGCKCKGNDGSAAGTVLDPFGGSGTVAAVAERLNRNSIYIDLNPAYAEMAATRLWGPIGRLKLKEEYNCLTRLS
jgi:DNA modification methylase